MTASRGVRTRNIAATNQAAGPSIQLTMPITPVSHGRTRRAITVGPYTVTEAVYAPRQRVSRHEHGWPSLTLVMDGDFEERFSRVTMVTRPGDVLTKPGAADHSNEYGPEGARCLLIGAEAYLADGQRDLAIKYYRKVLELRPGDENATRMLRQIGVP
jgi:quercetin dioxygenase-like cupin family protein